MSPINQPTTASHHCTLHPQQYHNLLSVSELCNAGCEVTFEKNDVIVQSNGVIVLQGWRDLPSHLCHVPLTNAMGIPPLSQHTEQYLTHNDHSVSNISKHMYNCEGTSLHLWFYHATFFLPAQTAFLAAIK